MEPKPAVRQHAVDIAGSQILVERYRDWSSQRFAQITAVLLIALTIGGCGLWGRVSGKQAAGARETQQLQQLQFKAMRYADEYVGRLVASVNAFQATDISPADRLLAQSWKVSQATAAYTDASGPNPTTNALDLVVLATLSRMVIEDNWVAERFGARAAPIRDVARQLEAGAWGLVDGDLTASQKQQLHKLIDTWREKNPHVRAVAYVHFLDFAHSIGRPQPGEAESTPGNIFSLVGLDPLSTLDPAIQEITQTRVLAERTIYYAQRVPALLDMQVERLTYQLAVMPETRDMLGDIDRVSRAAQQTGNLAEALPAIIARERAATINQFMGELAAQQDKMSALVVQLREALQAGGAMSDSVNTTIGSFNALMKQFNAPPPPGTPISPPGKPFDIADYTAAAKQMAATTQELIALIQAVNASTPAIASLQTKATGEVKGLVSFIVWRVAALIVLLAAVTLATMLIYRWRVGTIGRAPFKRGQG